MGCYAMVAFIVNADALGWPPLVPDNPCRTTHMLCRPNCPPGRRTKGENRLVFSSASEAIDAGYRPRRVWLPGGR